MNLYIPTSLNLHPIAIKTYNELLITFSIPHCNLCNFLTSNSYVRVKRKNQTFFIHISPSDTFEYIKSEVVSAYNSCSIGGDDNDVTTTNMNLYIAPKSNNVVENKDGDKSMSEKQEEPKGPIPDVAILSDHDVKNDDILYVTFGEGEEIDIAK